jgi:DNA gyrase subunit B
LIAQFGQGKDDSVTTQRYKGLGEMNAEQLWETTMNPATRTLKQVTIQSAADADLVFSMLMGDEGTAKKEFIETHAKYAKIDV